MSTQIRITGLEATIAELRAELEREKADPIHRYQLFVQRLNPYRWEEYRNETNITSWRCLAHNEIAQADLDRNSLRAELETLREERKATNFDLEMFRKSERELSDAYLRIRKLLAPASYDTEYGGADRFAKTEAALTALRSENARLMGDHGYDANYWFQAYEGQRIARCEEALESTKLTARIAELEAYLRKRQPNLKHACWDNLAICDACKVNALLGLDNNGDALNQPRK